MFLYVTIITKSLQIFGQKQKMYVQSKNKSNIYIEKNHLVDKWVNYMYYI